MRFPAGGYLGGGAGALARFATSEGDEPDPKLTQLLPAGARFVLDLPGGGGFHNPAERDPAAVARDIAEGLVSPAAAGAIYPTPEGPQSGS